MAFVLIGRIIAVDQQQTVASKNDASKTFQRRQVYLDCSRYDSIKGEQLSENKPLLEFAVQGSTYKDAQGNVKNFTGIRPYSIERYVPKSQQRQQQEQAIPQAAAPAPQPQAAAEPAPSIVTSQTGTDGLPF